MADNNLPEQTSARDIQHDSHDSLRRLQEEEDLARALKAGDPDALRVIFDRYHRLVLVTALRIVHDIGEAEDLMQSIFFEIFQKAAQFDPSKGTLSKWILQYAYHRSINRKNYLSLRHFYNAVDLHDSDGEEIWITKVSLPTQEAVRLVRELLAMLNCQHREVIECVFFGEMSLKEIAEETNQNLGTVRHHYYRGLKKLRDVLSHKNNQGEDGIAAYNGQMGPANA
jgi:RNA polymerase sigma-70 factor, ECF subfamily